MTPRRSSARRHHILPHLYGAKRPHLCVRFRLTKVCWSSWISNSNGFRIFPIVCKCIPIEASDLCQLGVRSNANAFLL